jgi:hypothetical protein
MAAYQTALDGALPSPEIGATRTIAGTVNAVVIGFLASGRFERLRPTSKAQYRRIFEGCAATTAISAWTPWHTATS